MAEIDLLESTIPGFDVDKFIKRTISYNVIIYCQPLPCFQLEGTRDDGIAGIET